MNNLNSNSGLNELLRLKADQDILDNYFQNAHLTALKTAKIESIYHKGVHYIKEIFKEALSATNPNIQNEEQWWRVFEKFRRDPPESFKSFQSSIPKRNVKTISKYRERILKKSYKNLITDTLNWINKEVGTLNEVDSKKAEKKFSLLLKSIKKDLTKKESKLPEAAISLDLFLSDIQANILSGIKNDCTLFCFLRFPALEYQKNLLDKERSFIDAKAKVKLADSMKRKFDKNDTSGKKKEANRGLARGDNDVHNIIKKIDRFIQREKIKLDEIESNEERLNQFIEQKKSQLKSSTRQLDGKTAGNERDKYHIKQEAFYLEKKAVVEWLKAIPITSANDQVDDKNKNVISLAFSFEGLKLLFDSKRFHDLFPKEDDDHTAFAEGIRKRCPSAFGYQNNENLDKIQAHALLIVSLFEEGGNNSNQHGQLIEYLKNGKDYTSFFKKIGHPMDFPFKEDDLELFYETGHIRKENNIPKEWFGFRDSISNPRFFADETKFKELKEKLELGSDEESIKYEESSKLGIVLRPDSLSPNPYGCGSFIAFLKLQQNKDAFEEKVKKLSDKLGVDEKKAGAYLIGRGKDGSLLHSLNENNQFGEGTQLDNEGRRCPFNAHIRKANPREGNNWKEKRIVRRGKLYGENNSKEKGMLFLSYQSSLLHFENIINNGIYSYNRKGSYIGKDPLFMKSGDQNRGVEYLDKNGKLTKIYGEEIDPIVEFKGGQYFYAPSISFIKHNLENCL